ncbi:hypothetical protein [Bosea sp. 685]|uniref:hypothetical protein n=1 Tax=Bosea sp. 685 TaxID=3080057 RepID=UPI002892A1A9|nr:hypothetical protein [Bosea sp. 685]WNJ88703.1 hypothetical protein RMR04_20095 [Bosea sp. 685]
MTNNLSIAEYMYLADSALLASPGFRACLRRIRNRDVDALIRIITAPGMTSWSSCSPLWRASTS